MFARPFYECLRTRVLFREEIFGGDRGGGCWNVAAFDLHVKTRRATGAESFSSFVFSFCDCESFSS